MQFILIGHPSLSQVLNNGSWRYRIKMTLAEKKCFLGTVREKNWQSSKRVK